MRIFLLTRAQRYGIVILGIAIATLLRLAIDPYLGDADLPFLLSGYVIILAAWYGGIGPGLLATALSFLIGDYLFLAPKYSILRYDTFSDFARSIILVFAGTTFSMLFHRLRQAVKGEMECLQRFRLLVESARDYVMFTLDPQGRVACWNSGAAKITGYTGGEIIGRDVSIFYPPEDVESGKPRRELEIATAEGRYEKEDWQVRKDGSRFWASGVIAPLRDYKGELRGFAKVTRDVTERKLADEALRESQRFAQQIVDVSPNVIYIYDVRQRKNVFVNRRLAAALGYDPGQDAHEADFLLSILHPDDRQAYLHYIERFPCLRDDEIAEFEGRVRHANGEWLWVHFRDKVFTRYQDGSVREIIGTATDVTERKNVEEKAKFMSDLHQALSPLADPKEIMAVAARKLGEHLGADRCAYGEVEADENHYVITHDYTRGGAPSIVGRYRMSDLGAEELRILRENRPYVINDIEAEAPAGADLSAYRRAEIRALVCVPLNKAGRFVARMAVHQKTPRRWSSAEIKLVTIVANRLWESIERARAERILKESEERYRSFIAHTSEAIWRFELEQPIPVTLPEDEQIERLYQFAYLAECNDAMARMYGYESADQIIGARVGDLLIRSDPKNIAHLRAFRRAGYKLTDSESHEVDRRGNMKYFLNTLTGIVENGAVVRAWGTQRDITEQRLAEEALRESEKRLRRITDATQDALWEIDLKTNLLWWSEGARPLFGHGPGDLAPGLEDWYDSIHPEDRDRVRAKFRKFMEGADPGWVDEYRFRRADGSYVYIHDQGRKFYDQSGAPVWIAGAMSDITERKQAEDALRESEERFSKAFRASPEGLVITRLADGLILEVNDSFVSLSGYDQDEMIGKSTIDLGLYVDPADRQRMLAILKERNYVRDFEFVIKRKSGEERLISLSAEPLELRGEHCWLTIVRDITERKRAEDALRRSEEQARRQLAQIEAIYATAPVGLCFVDNEQRYVNINDRLAEIDGKSVEEHLGRTPREALSELADMIEPIFRRVMETGEPVLNIELSAETAAQPGVVRHFIGSYYPIKNGDGRTLGINVVVMEITQRKKIEEERERLLRQEKAARAEAEAANRMKDEFLATISHELRTPLTSILGWARMLTSGSLSEPQERHAVDVIAQSAQSQARLIDDILDVSRIITGRLKLDAQPVEIERVFQAAIDVVRPSAEAKGIALRTMIDTQGAIVPGDANRLQQAIWNLLSNAVKFTNEGGRIEARLTRDEGRIEISVADTGIGVEPQFLPYVFERFRQADSASTRKYSGLGLGLAIVRHIVEMHGGGVSASSPGKGQGATFKIYLPLAATSRLPQQESRRPESEVKQAERIATEESRRLDGVRVLVVEDNPDTLEMLRFILRESGAEVIAAESADEAMDALERFRPDALVSDIAMPGKDGYDLIREVRSRAPEQGGKIPAVAVTAYARAEDRMRALASGFQMHVAKPVDPNELIAVVASLTGHIHF